MENIKRIEVIQSRKLTFLSARGEYKFNDILKVVNENYTTDCYLFLNNYDYYVKMPYDSILVSQIKDITWDKDNENNIIVSKSHDGKYLKDITALHSINFNVLRGSITDLM